MTQEELLQRLESDLRDLLEQARGQLAPLPLEELRYRPAGGGWNKLECLAHLNAFFDAYLSRIDLAIHKGKARQWQPAGDVRYSGRGRRALRRADPANKKRYKSRKRYNFNNQSMWPDVVKSFIINCEMLLRLLRAAREVDLNKAKVPKAHTWNVRYRLGELLEWLVVHARRHVAQAVSVRASA